MTSPVTPTPQQRGSTLDNLEKGTAWVLGLLIAALGAATAVDHVVPASVSAVMVGTLPVLVAVERYLTNK